MKARGIAALAAAALVAVSIAAASGQAYGQRAVYQIGISFNCNNPSFCGPELGGFWGWAEFDNDNTGDAELTGCAHLAGGPGGGGGGAGHFRSHITGWFIGSNGNFWIQSEVVTFTGHGPPVTLVNPDPSYPFDTGIPATPGHYSTVDFFGFQPPPGVAFQVQVIKIPNR